MNLLSLVEHFYFILWAFGATCGNNFLGQCLELNNRKVKKFATLFDKGGLTEKKFFSFYSNCLKDRNIGWKQC